jgi:hypothetical protein
VRPLVVGTARAVPRLSSHPQPEGASHAQGFEGHRVDRQGLRAR